MCFYSNNTFNYGMFAVLKIYQYILLEQKQDTYDMNLFLKCNLDTKITCNKKCLLEYAVFYHNYEMVKILLEHNCNVINNESFIYSIISCLDTNNDLKDTFKIFKLLLFHLKKQNIQLSKNIIKDGLEMILKEKDHYPTLIKYIINYYPNILQYVSIYYKAITVNLDNLYLIKYPMLCLKFNRLNYKYYNNTIKNNIFLYLSIMNRLNVLPPEICEYILCFIELDKLKLKYNTYTSI
jgi:hypothetical protein